MNLRSINLDLKLIRGLTKITKTLIIEIKARKIEKKVKMVKNLKISQLVVILTKIQKFKIKIQKNKPRTNWK